MMTPDQQELFQELFQGAWDELESVYSGQPQERRIMATISDFRAGCRFQGIGEPERADVRAAIDKILGTG